MLPLHVKPKPRETLPSFLSRMAAANGCGPAQFSVEMGFSIKRVLNLDPWPLERLCQLAGIDAQEMEDLVSWTGAGIGGVRTCFRNEVFISRALRNPTVRGCPVCLREDAEGSASPTKSMYMRGDWQLRGNDICLRHQKALVPLWKHSQPVARSSISERLTENLNDIISGARDGHEVLPSEYDYWLEQRLVDGTDHTWLGSIGLYPAMTFCELLGVELLRTGAVTGCAEGRPSVIGFLAASEGPSRIEEAFSGLLAHAKDTALEPRGVYGSLFAHFDRASCEDPAFAPLRDLLRSHIFRCWPLAAGEKILGQSLASRRIHSVASASKEIGVGQALLDAFLTEAGALEPEDPRGPRQKTFELSPFAQLIADIPTWVGPIEMQKTIGATRAELRALMDDEVLVPRTNLPKIKSPWSAADGTAFLERMLSMSQRCVSPSEKGWIGLQAARNHFRLALSEILNAIENKKLTMGQMDGGDGYHSLVVMKTELTALRDAHVQSATRDLVPAAAFGREIGLRGKDTFLSFISDRHSPSQQARHPVTGQLFYYLSLEDIAAFRSRFVTPSMMTIETGAHRNTVIAALTSHRVQRFMPGGKEYGPIYLRKDARPALISLC
ncbi:TniQ family protein [Celeribacter halophilus]|uniref:TniQ family protein n=1 Tax=Celeribacter halophilus TaxID=576117 RepID=UPI0026E23BC2|nr:TniQ family protein [Celeribacter halophilus]MDO6723398.1 TniQ family protein [Celeribacter halophilus]